MLSPGRAGLPSGLWTGQDASSLALLSRPDQPPAAWGRWAVGVLALLADDQLEARLGQLQAECPQGTQEPCLAPTRSRSGFR